ncbi:MAG: hypothetical protein LBT20_04935 [Clostridiales bacterium]|jgi:hypothetical protein|nr:hypothetical protein [Clostridiales bacterium]
MGFFEKIYDAFANAFSSVEPGLLLFIFVIVIAAAFVYAYLTSAKILRGYVAALKRATAYLVADDSAKLAPNNVIYFFKDYIIFLPKSLQSRLTAYFAEEKPIRPSLYITEADGVKSVSDRIPRRLAFAVYDVVIFVCFALFSAIALCSGLSAFAVGALLPFAIGLALKYLLKLRAARLERVLSSEFYNFVNALDDSVKYGDDPVEIENGILKRASELIESLIREERDAQRYYFITATDGLSKELKDERLAAIAENVSIICGETAIPSVTLKRVFRMIADAKPFYTEKPEIDIVHECLVKLKNAIIKAEL